MPSQLVFVIGPPAHFSAWCAQHRIHNPIAAGIRHIGDSATLATTTRPLHCKLVLLPGADPRLLAQMRLAGWSLPPDPVSLAQAERDRHIAHWSESITRWYEDTVRNPHAKTDLPAQPS